MSVNKPLPHDAARLHVTGRARYVDDIPTPANCLHLAFGISPIAAGRLTALDLDAVRAAPGVAGVWTHTDLPSGCDCSPSNHDEPMLSDGTIHYQGLPLFLVAADSHLAARKAVALAGIETEAATPILTIEQALDADSRFEEGPRIWTRGDVETAINRAAHQIDDRIEIGGQEHFYLEGQAALVTPQEDGDMHVVSSTQHPTEIQHKVADALNLSMHNVRVETRRMGGGFGGKESQGNALAIACAVVAAATGRPAKMRYDRDDDMIITGKRHDFRIDYRVGVDEDGVIEGIEFLHYTRCGWAQDLSLPVADRAMLHADNAYFLPAVRIESHRLKTNTQSATAFRGFGGPQGVVGIERVMDHIAHVLGRDPLQIRRANYYDRSEGGAAPHSDKPSPPGGIFAAKKPRNVTPYGQDVRDFILHEMTDALAKSCDYATRRADVAAWNATHPLLKRGLALTPVKFGISFTLTHLNQAGALVHVYQDGSIAMNHGGTEMGQGLFQKVAQVAAAVFGVRTEKVRITATDTGKVPNTSATAASSGSDLNGAAVRIACETLRTRMAEYLAGMHQCPPEEVVFDGGRVSVGGQDMDFAEAAAFCYAGRVSLSATGFYKTPDITWDRLRGEGRPFYYFAYGAACTEVVVDTLTGEYRMLRTDILHDAGRSLNPALDIGQVEGGFVQGAGWLTTEELVWDDHGRLRTHAPSTYKIPACSDAPEVFNVALWDGENQEDTVYRSKAVGEPPLMLGVSALMALSDAVAACGSSYPALDAPATPERVLAAIGTVRA
ncbi:xanthine dehydrogenase molybdopterin binding subunit [Antarctobacter heliothermus]|uniref:Xanthine dehydrogenase, molybdenum binding subunit apoprotein n=1 Tax=Antarctobacter heliothermus TaxID=74033 RepID=A0A239DLK9_9RHOB|nr:xanthine dehydrogenase molybdopterin binding subunit [Antarctobacter heliothermus]SNS32712.1 xanthine dehydrogenase, molybdenum binding subunit apoprotein [Antarctobacter heliothermus]